MNKKLEGSSLLSSLLILTGILTLLFFTKENWLKKESVANGYYQKYLSSKMALLNKLEQDQCSVQQTQEVTENVKILPYSYLCEKSSLFIKPKPTKDKYIAVDNIAHWLDLKTYQADILYISSLSELPKNSETNPKIVVAKNAIDEKLEDNFYGIVITDYYFDITGNKKIFGVLYSSFDNEREERNLTFRKAVVDNLEKQYSEWHLVPNSKNLLKNN